MLQGEVDLFAVARLLGGIEHDHIEPLAAGRRLAQPGEQVGLDEADVHLIQPGVLPGQGERLFVEIDADHFLGAAERLGVNGETAGVAAEIEHAAAGAEGGQRPAVVALVEKEAGLVLAAGGHAEADAVFRDDFRRRRFRGVAVERLLFLDVLLGEPVEAASG